MRIINLIENTPGRAGCAYAHGLSFYIETEHHKALLDLGPSQETLSNAEVLDIRLEDIDTVILSHGHYDHSGGIMPFAAINPHAAIYMQDAVDGDYYSDGGEDATGKRFRYIGIDKRIVGLPQAKVIHGDYVIDDEMSLLTIKERTHKLPFTNKRLLVKKNGHYAPDDFLHEQFLVLKEDDRYILLSGCAHNGILSILDAFKEAYDRYPDVVISGFHLMKRAAYSEQEANEIKEIAEKLKEYPTLFYSCHCTGLEAYDIMKDIMGEKLHYVQTGEEVPLEEIK